MTTSWPSATAIPACCSVTGATTVTACGRMRATGAQPEIPTKRSCKVQHSVNRRLYALRSRIECFINRLKNCRRVATRYDHTASSFLSFALLGCIRLWIRFVHAA